MKIKHGDILKRTKIKDENKTTNYFLVEEKKEATYTLFLCDKDGNIFDRQSYGNIYYGKGIEFINSDECKWEVYKSEV